LPALPNGVIVAHDVDEYRGPLNGLATGLRALADRVDAAYATGCDVPLLAPRFVDRMFTLLNDHDVAVPRDGQYHHPLAAVYRRSVLPSIEALIEGGRMRPVYLFDEVATREIAVDELRDVDPQLLTLENLNSPESYESALRAAGYSLPSETHGGASGGER
jgi:molybdopterin-guanine dinucleotide biosynthesis protein A